MMEIRQDNPSLGLLSAYSSIPISFHGNSQMRVQRENDRWVLTETNVAPFFKDYDHLEHPTEWAAQFDLSNWRMFSALDGGQRVGGAIVAIRTPGVEMLEGRDDLAVLWDIRVQPEYRNQRIGSQLFAEAAHWSMTHGCRELKVETQQVNVAACKFYERMGCRLRDARWNLYPDMPEEVQLLWYREL
jgi:ribosomal protein S18 acetylase RimI-like enzyme